MAKAADIGATLAFIADSIGDVEQTSAGEERELDLYLSKTPDSGLSAAADDLPGQAVVSGGGAAPVPADEIAPAAISPGDAGREGTNQVLRQRLAAARAGKSSTKPQRGRL
jgi:hypothetical protein